MQSRSMPILGGFTTLCRLCQARRGGGRVSRLETPQCSFMSSPLEMTKSPRSAALLLHSNIAASSASRANSWPSWGLDIPDAYENVEGCKAAQGERASRGLPAPCHHHHWVVAKREQKESAKMPPGVGKGCSRMKCPPYGRELTNERARLLQPWAAQPMTSPATSSVDPEPHYVYSVRSRSSPVGDDGQIHHRH